MSHGVLNGGYGICPVALQKKSAASAESVRQRLHEPQFPRDALERGIEAPLRFLYFYFKSPVIRGSRE
jgi:hypothetical protein